MNKEDILKQICKMISSGDIPKGVYDKYLSKTPLGFMNYEELYDFLKEQNKKYKEIFDKIKRYIEECLKLTPTEDRTEIDDVLDNEYKYLLNILKEVE